MQPGVSNISGLALPTVLLSLANNLTKKWQLQLSSHGGHKHHLFGPCTEQLR
jgi:hypothetical protein